MLDLGLTPLHITFVFGPKGWYLKYVKTWAMALVERVGGGTAKHRRAFLMLRRADLRSAS